MCNFLPSLFSHRCPIYKLAYDGKEKEWQVNTLQRRTLNKLRLTELLAYGKKIIAYHHELASTTTCMRRVRSVRAKTQCLESNTLPKGQQIGRRTQPSPRFILPVIWGRTENRILVSLPAWLDVCFSCTTLGHIMERKGQYVQRKYSFSWIAVYLTSHLHARVWWNPCSHHCLHSRAVIWQHIRVWITQDW